MMSRDVAIGVVLWAAGGAISAATAPGGDTLQQWAAQGGVYAILGFIVYHFVAKTHPRMIESHERALKNVCQTFSEESEKRRSEFRRREDHLESVISRKDAELQKCLKGEEM